MKGRNKGFRGEIKGTRAKEENKRVQIVLRESECENKMCKGRNKGLRELINGTRANEEFKR